MRKGGLMLATLLFAVCLFCTATGARAMDDTTIDEASPQEMVNGMANKLARGVTNVATGWLELPKQICITSKEQGLAVGLTVGMLKGIGMTVVRTVVGASEAVSFPLAYPGFYDPIFDPAYVWQRE